MIAYTLLFIISLYTELSTAEGVFVAVVCGIGWIAKLIEGEVF